MSMGFPPFTYAIKWLVIINAAVYLLWLLLRAAMPALAGYVDLFLFLRPVLAVHGYIWQLVTYSFFHDGLFHILFNMLTLWMFGATLESEWGSRKFVELYFFGAVGAALSTITVTYLGIVPVFDFMATDPRIATVGASGAIYAVMVAFATLHGNQEFMMFPLPFTIRAKYLVAILVFISLVGTFQGFGAGSRGQSVAYIAHLGGAFFGWFYVRFVPRRGLGISEHYFELRNSYYRWKRRRAGRKFEVYMRKHERSQYFDQYGNYRGPEEQNGREKGNGEHRGPWVQ
jgi:membrane associated rhomboid family serine protease